MNADNTLCACCGSKTVPQDLQEAQDDFSGAWCWSCIKSFRNNGQLQSLFEAISDSLNHDNEVEFKCGKPQDKALFALQMIEEGHIKSEGGPTGAVGSHGFHDSLLRYLAVDTELGINYGTEITERALVTFHPQEEVEEDGEIRASESSNQSPHSFMIPIDEVIGDDGSLPVNTPIEDDSIRQHENAPEWVQSWEGPFTLVIETPTRED
jgi:hypothetical protein